LVAGEWCWHFAPILSHWQLYIYQTCCSLLMWTMKSFKAPGKGKCHEIVLVHNQASFHEWRNTSMYSLSSP
jgi:hypothetical protein